MASVFFDEERLYGGVSLPVVDQKVLESSVRINGTIRPSLLEKLIPIFLLDAPKLLTAITTGLSNSDAALVKISAHSLKSSSAWLGASMLSELSRQTEVLATEGRLSDVPSLMQDMRAQFELVADLLPVLRDELLQLAILESDR